MINVFTEFVVKTTEGQAVLI